MPLFARRAALSALLATLAVAGCSSVSLDEPIEGPVWRLASLGSDPVADGKPQRDAFLQFDRSSGRVNGSGGCNRLSGSYQRGTSQLKIGPLATTRMACTDPERGALESRFMAALQATTSYRLLGPQLSLLDSGGFTVAVLRAAER